MSKSKLLICSQVYWPDTSSVSQHLSDLCEYLVSNGWQLRVISSALPYEDQKGSFKAFEVYQGVEIERLKHAKFSKKSTLGRLCTFFSFQLALFIKLLFKSKSHYDYLLVTSVPPLLPFVVAFIAKIKNKQVLYWALDIQPHLALATGLIKERSLKASIFKICNKFTLNNIKSALTLDKDMKQTLAKDGLKESQIHICPVWPVLLRKCHYNRNNNPFRLKNHWGEKQIIMYSGNFAYCHSLETILLTSQKLINYPHFHFVFIGGGSQLQRVKNHERNQDNLVHYPFQKREDLHLSLGASDYQVVVMGDETLGLSHPNKIYAAMLAKKVIIYVGPQKSFIAKHLKNCPGNILVCHGEVDLLIEKLIQLDQNRDRLSAIANQNYHYAKEHFNEKVLKEKMLKWVNTLKDEN